MDLKKLVNLGFAVVLIAAFVSLLNGMFFRPGTFDWMPVLYWIWEAVAFIVCFGIGYYFWQQATASDWDARFRDLVRKLLVENPQIRDFSNKLEENRQWLAKRE